MDSSLKVAENVKSDLGYLDQCGVAGRARFREIRSTEAVKLFAVIEEALVLSRKRSHDRAFELFAEAETAIEIVAVGSPALACLLLRHLYAARAYGFYLKSDLDSAKRDLQLAFESLRNLLDFHSFLCPLAMGFTDFLVQRARIARRQNRWKEAQECLDQLRGIYRGSVAFCTLESGRQVWIDDIRQLGRALDLEEKERDWFKRLISDNIDIEILVDSIETTVFTLPDQVIPYQ